MEQLLEKARKGDKKAFEEIINSIYKRLYVIAKARLMDEQDAQDIVWESITTAYTKMRFLRDLNKFNAWITKIVINNCNRIIRSRKIKEVALEYEKIENNFVLDSEYLNIEDSIDFFELLSILNYEERTIMAMYYSEEYTTKEIANILKLNESTVRSKINRAKQKIKSKYDRSSYDER
ncbi:MAG: RNA polymerase sigma factor [Clostridia bacterium]|nr:RNA polymerase sigma factor [Clostridia bacterium]